MAIPLLFDISGGELLVVLLFALIFFGSKGIPDIARTMGRALRQVRDARDEVQREIHRGVQDVRRQVEAPPESRPQTPAPPQEPPTSAG